jgi:SAM-dependent methyltransferase
MQRTDEWIKNYNEDYFNKQFNEPYRSTVAFCDWLEKIKVLSSSVSLNILDVGTGKGANIYYMAQRFKSCQYTGIDINPEFVAEGNQIFKTKNLDNQCWLEVADIYNFEPKHVNTYDGIVSYQTLSWLPDYVQPLKAMAGLGAEWIALTSLFFDGDVNCKIELEEYNRSTDREPKKTFYNIYSLRLVERLLATHGYSKFSFVPFEMDIDLPKPGHKIMGTYTEKLGNGKRLQISGPLLMSWYFIIASR